MQLLELAPHITRLVPAADRYLQSRSDGRESQRLALEQVAEGLRGDLKLMAAAQAGIGETLEARMSRLWTLMLAGMILLAILAVCTIAVLLHMEHSIHGS